MGWLSRIFRSKSPKGKRVRRKISLPAEAQVLRAAALRYITAYKEKFGGAELRTAYDHLNRIRELFLNKLSSGCGPQNCEVLSQLQDYALKAIESGPHNAWIFHRCYGLIDDARRLLGTDQLEWHQNCLDTLAKKWPAMATSYALARAASKGTTSLAVGLMGITHVKEPITGVTLEIPRAAQSPMQMALGALKFCPANPYAWTQLHFTYGFSGHMEWADICKKMERSLKTAQRADMDPGS